jgi:hypothetical protein
MASLMVKQLFYTEKISGSSPEPYRFFLYIVKN